MQKLILTLISAILIAWITACAPGIGKSVAPKRIETYDHLLEQARTRIDDRDHTGAIALLDEAGRKAHGRPEWEYEKARAFFSMSRFREAGDACRRALDSYPDFYDAMSLGWAARLETEEFSNESKTAVSDEIEMLLKRSGDTGALWAAYEGYSAMRDEAPARALILKLADRAVSSDKYDEIAAGLFEEIIMAAHDPAEYATKIELMETYIECFPDGRVADYLVYRLLMQEAPAVESTADLDAYMKLVLPAGVGTRQLKTGVAQWLIEQEKMPEKAIQLLGESLALAGTGEKPDGFTDDLWTEEQEKEIDHIHYLLGRAWFAAGKYDKTAAELGRIAGKNRNWSDVYYYLGAISRFQGKPDQAISHFRQALAIEYRKDSEAALKELLRKEHEYTGDPALYFPGISNGIYFTDITAAAGLEGVKAGRVAWGHCDGDGFADLLFDGHLLFRNTGTGRFTDVSKSAGLISLTDTNGGIWADYDNDGDFDIMVTAHAGNRLLRNIGNGVFNDVTDRAFGQLKPERTEAAALGDLDNDGDLDLYTADYESGGGIRGVGTHDKLYRNNGDGTFMDISRAAGIEPDEAMCGRGVTWTDINNDGRQEIVVANYRLDPNFLWMNPGGGVLVDAAKDFGVRGTMNAGYFGHSIGPVSGDLDNDGLPDLFISNLAHPRYIQFSDLDMVLINQGPPGYHLSDAYPDSGIAFEETNSDPALADVDNDGDLDLYITSIYPGRYSHLYTNDGTGRFTDVSWYTRTRVENGWGAAFADFNNDGFVDLLVASTDGVHLLQNNGNRNHWLKVNIRDSRCNRFGIGSKITVEYAGKRQVREIVAGRGTGSQDETSVTFGLGKYAGPVTVHARTLCGDSIENIVDSSDRTVKLVNRD